MDNISSISEINESQESKEEKSLILKTSQSFNESNLMTLPIFSLKRKRVGKLVRTWNKDGKEIGLIVKAPEDTGVPTIYELDVLMALFKILAEQINNTITLSSDNKITNIPKVINFTYRELARQMDLKGFGKKTKERLERSIYSLVETTLYTNLAFRDQTIGNYVVDFNGRESSRILENYKEYSISKQKIMDKKLLSPKDIKEYQSVEISDFFFKNMCSNYLKLYDYDKYKALNKGIAKKILLILTQWSHGYEKFINMEVLYKYIGLEVNTTQEEYRANRDIKDALEDLKSVKFIQNYVFENKKGVLFVFNVTVKNRELGLTKYNSSEEICSRLREIGVSWDDINKYCRLDTASYIAGLLRYSDYKLEKGEINKSIESFVKKGLPYRSYDVDKFEIGMD